MCNNTEFKLDLNISGTEFSTKFSLKLLSVYNLKHLPSLVLPALPDLWTADALLIGCTNKLSTLTSGLNTFCLHNPASTTYTIPSIVTEVSATLVHIMHFLLGDDLNTAFCF